jgi:hypothetical protein
MEKAINLGSSRYNEILSDEETEQKFNHQVKKKFYPSS